jgi:hypothetical protein
MAGLDSPIRASPASSLHAEFLLQITRIRLLHQLLLQLRALVQRMQPYPFHSTLLTAKGRRHPPAAPAPVTVTPLLTEIAASPSLKPTRSRSALFWPTTGLIKTVPP